MRKNSELVLEVDNGSYVAQLHFSNLNFFLDSLSINHLFPA